MEIYLGIGIIAFLVTPIMLGVYGGIAVAVGYKVFKALVKERKI